MNKRKAIELNKRNCRKKAIRRQLVAFLKKHGYLKTTSYKTAELVRMFADYNKLAMPVDWRKWVNDVFESGEYEDFRLHCDNRKIENWNKLRKIVLDTFGRVCMKCKSTKDITVDHIKPFSTYPELANNLDNMQVLCRSCNSSKSNKKIVDYRFK